MTENHETPDTQPSTPPKRLLVANPLVRRTLTAALLAYALAATIFDLGYSTHSSTPAAAARPTPTQESAVGSTPGSGTCVSPGTAATPSDTSTMNSADMDLSTFIGKEAGTRLAGNAPLNLDADQVRTLGDSVPAGATVDACADRITFTGSAASFVVEAVPPGGPDMIFRIAGLIDPTVVVRNGAAVTVEFVNADSDQAHGWLVTTAQPPFGFRPATGPAFPRAQADVIGDPVAGRQGARIVTFTMGSPGRYQYICPMPGHAEMGMHGDFIVTP